jgi:hypothetical protein
MKHLVTSLSLVTLLVASAAGAAVAQSPAPDASAGAPGVGVVITFDQPLPAGLAAADGTDPGVTVSLQDDHTLRIELPAGVTAGTDISVDLASGSAASTATRVSANSASMDELVAALEGAGVTAADRWADEIVEYRPYDAGDATLAKLQDELVKYDPSPETLAGILSVLEP